MIYRYLILITIFFTASGCGRFDTQYTSVVNPDEVSTFTVSCYNILGVPSLCIVTEATTTTIRIENVVTRIVERIVKKEVITQVPIEKIVTRVEKQYVETDRNVDIEKLVEFILIRIKEYVKPSDIIDIPTEDIVDETTDYITNPPPPNEDKDSTTMGDVRDDELIPIPPVDDKKDTTDPNSENNGTNEGKNDGGNNPGGNTGTDPDGGLNNGGNEDGSTPGGNTGTDPDGGLNNGGNEDGSTPGGNTGTDPDGGLNNGGNEDGSTPGGNTGTDPDGGLNNGGNEDGSTPGGNTGTDPDGGLNNGGNEDDSTPGGNTGTDPDDTNNGDNNEGSTPGGNTGNELNSGTNNIIGGGDLDNWTPPEGIDTIKLRVAIGPKRMQFEPHIDQPGVNIDISCDIDGTTVHPSLDSYSVFRGDRWNLWGVQVWCVVPRDLDDSATTIHVDVSDFKRWCGLTSADIDIEKFRQNDDGSSNAIGGMAALIDLSPNPVPLCNIAPTFTEGDSTTRSVAENLSSGAAVGVPVLATDQDDDTLEYSISGTGADSFSINSSSGQISTSKKLNYEDQDTYSVTVTADDDNGGTTDITVNISVSDENDKPVFTEGFFVGRSVAENLAIGALIGDPVLATDEDGDTLEYSITSSNTDIFGVDSSSAQLSTKVILNHEEQSSYTVTLSVTDNNGGTNGTFVTVSVTDANDAPVFREGNTALRAIIESASSGTNVGHAVSATDEDDDTLEYSISGTDASSFSLNTSTGRLSTNTTLDYDTQSSYSVTVSVTDNNGGSDEISVEIDVLEFYVEKQEFLEVYYALKLDGNHLTVQCYTIRGYGYDGSDPIYVDNYYKFEDGSSEQTSTGWSSVLEEAAISDHLDDWKADYSEDNGFTHGYIKASVHGSTLEAATKTLYQTICSAADGLGTWDSTSRGITYPSIDDNTSDNILDLATLFSYLDDDDCDPNN